MRELRAVQAKRAQNATTSPRILQCGEHGSPLLRPEHGKRGQISDFCFQPFVRELNYSSSRLAGTKRNPRSAEKLLLSSVSSRGNTSADGGAETQQQRPATLTLLQGKTVKLHQPVLTACADAFNCVYLTHFTVSHSD